MDADNPILGVLMCSALGGGNGRRVPASTKSSAAGCESTMLMVQDMI